jgi:hypothetical protein
VPTFTLLAEEELLAADDGLVTWLVGQSAVIVDAANPGAALNGVARPPTRAPARQRRLLIWSRPAWSRGTRMKPIDTAR